MDPSFTELRGEEEHIQKMLPTTKYSLYNKMQWLEDWDQVAGFYKIKEHLELEKPTEPDERWHRLETTANLQLRNHLTAAVYMNICNSQAEPANERWTYLRKNFLENKDHDILD